MGGYAIPVYFFLGFLICGIELLRPKFHSKIDFLRPVSLLYMLAFSITPILVYFLGFEDIIRSSFMPGRNANEWAFFFGAIVSTIGYVAIVVGVYWREIAFRKQPSAVKVRHSYARPSSVVDTQTLILAGLGFMLAGAGVTWVYASSLGGLAAMLESAALVRNSEIEPEGAFLRPLMPLMAVSSFFFFSAWYTASSKTLRWISCFLLLTAFCGSLLVLYHLGARQTIITYFLTFLIAHVIVSERWNLIGLCGGMAIVLFVWIFGKTAFYYFLLPEELTSQIEATSQSSILSQFLDELSFAYMATANTVASVPWLVDFRWFLDFILGVLYNIPDRLLPAADLPWNIYQLNTSLMITGGKGRGTIPLGLDALGYYSFGAAGTMIICFLFGLALRKLQSILALNGTAEVAVFQAAIMMYMTLRVTYADPVFALQDGLALFLGIAVFLAIRRSSLGRPASRVVVHRRRAGSG
jgi:oligosaccharide repeat unit polymerase